MTRVPLSVAAGILVHGEPATHLLCVGMVPVGVFGRLMASLISPDRCRTLVMSGS